MARSGTAAIFERSGRVIAWLEDNEIFDLRGAPLYFLEGDEVFDYGARHNGWFSKGFFRDRSGHALAFVDGATDGPMTPMTAIEPISPVMAITPVHPVTPVTPMKPMFSLSWSSERFY